MYKSIIGKHFFTHHCSTCSISEIIFIEKDFIHFCWWKKVSVTNFHKKWDLMERMPLSTITNKKTVAFSKIYILPLMQEKFEDAKGVIRKCKP
jgi:hypothetical protein